MLGDWLPKMRSSSLLTAIAAGLLFAMRSAPQGPITPPAPPPSNTQTHQQKAAAATSTRSQKLVLTDGTYQMVREYQRTGDRVRYYSAERGAWEEVPASMVDWDATAKAAQEDQKVAAAELDKVHKQEEAKKMDNVTDIDASLPVAAGVYLPDGEGMFVVEGKSVRVMDQVGSQIKTDKKRLIAQIMSPVPLVPGKMNVTLQGARAKLRLSSKNPEFYLREPAYDPDKASAIKKSNKPEDSGPDVELIKAKVTRNTRQLESINTLMGQTMGSTMNEISVQRWEVAPSVYRFTLSQALAPGEYVLAQVEPDGLDLFVWEFGVDE